MDAPASSACRLALRWDGAAFVPCDGISPWDRGFRYGMLVFESFPVVDGTAHWLDRHLERLHANADACGITLPPGAAACAAAALAATSATGFGRILATAGSGEAAHGELLLLVEPRARPTASLRLAISDRPWTPRFPGRKTGLYWENMDVLAAAGRDGFDDAVLIDPEDRIVSTAVANLHVIRGATVITPSRESGARPGVVREWLLRHADVREATLRRADLDHADGWFVSNHWCGIRPVSALASRSLPPHPLALELARTLRAAEPGLFA